MPKYALGGMASLSTSERAALADLLEDVGPDQPTLCAGWDTYDLAAHLVVRERRPDSTPGLILPAMAGWTERVRRGARENTSFPDLVRTFRAGAPLWSPLGLPFVESATNTVEYFIHAEDVRRAQPGRELRELPEELEQYLWSRLRRGARLMVRSAPVGVTLAAPGYGLVVAHTGEPMVTVSGAPSELTLFCSGRQQAARVTTTGDPAAADRLISTRFGA